LNKELEDEKVKLTLARNTINAEYIEIAEDSSSWVEVKSKYGQRNLSDTIRIPTSDIKRISYKNNTLGALEGFGFGTLTGLSFYLLGRSAVKETDNFGEALGVAMVMGLGVITSPIIGLITGAIIGHEENYILIKPDTSVDGYEKGDSQQLSIGDKSYVRVIFSSVVEKGSGYIIILWQKKLIRLQRSEYSHRGTTKEGQPYIVVPNYIYESKFK
jgi:hypothetical protein